MFEPGTRSNGCIAHVSNGRGEYWFTLTHVDRSSSELISDENGISKHGVPFKITVQLTIVPMKSTGNAISVVVKEIFDGFSRTVVSGATINSFPPCPPLPDILALLRVAAWLKASMPSMLLLANAAGIHDANNIPLRSDVTLNKMPEIGTLPMDVFATIFAVPCKPSETDDVSVTAVKN